jgi:hypothetical protein
MIATLLLATLTAAPGRPPAAGVEPAHAAAEGALLRAAFPDHDPKSGFLGHKNGYLSGRSSACAENGTCFLAVAASDDRDGREPGTAHLWSTFFAFRAAPGGWLEIASAAGQVIHAGTRGLYRVAVHLDGDGPFITVSTASSGSSDGDTAAVHTWSWDGKKFQPVFTAATVRKGAIEAESSFALCADRPSDRPSWEVRTREREGRGTWTDARVRVTWGGQGWVEKPADRACVERGGSVAVAIAPAPPAAPAPAPAPAPAAAPAAVKIRSASASRTATAPRGQPQATAPSSAIDGDRKTAWVPGGKKGGVGEWLQLDLSAPAVLGSVQLLGTCPGADGKTAPRLKKVRLRFQDGPAQEEALADSQAPQSITVKRKTPVKWIRIELAELYAGTKRPDACLTDVTLRER